MNEDYLWDKTGDDPEVRTLEDALSAFRHSTSAAPSLPGQLKTVPVPTYVKPFWMRFVFAGPAFATVLAVLAAWAAFSTDDPSDHTPVDLSRNAPIATKSSPLSADDPAYDEAPKIERTSPRDHQQNRIKASVAEPKRKRQRPQLITRSSHKAPSLTAEEKYAYDRLMLALSITGSRLKMVKDAVDGTGDDPSPNEAGTR